MDKNIVPSDLSHRHTADKPPASSLGRKQCLQRTLQEDSDLSNNNDTTTPKYGDHEPSMPIKLHGSDSSPEYFRNDNNGDQLSVLQEVHTIREEVKDFLSHLTVTDNERELLLELAS